MMYVYICAHTSYQRITCISIFTLTDDDSKTSYPFPPFWWKINISRLGFRPPVVQVPKCHWSTQQSKHQCHSQAETSVSKSPGHSNLVVSTHLKILLMAEILHQLVVFPIIYRVSCIPGGAGFQPSTVLHPPLPRKLTNVTRKGTILQKEISSNPTQPAFFRGYVSFQGG